jgi:exodeoxyribonuclease VII large subunit
MPESYNDKKIFSLLEVTRSIQRTIAERYSSAFWVKAEMNKLNFYSHSGHCYPDLVEKKDGKVIAQLRSSLWKDDYRRVNQKFLDVLKEPLKDGIKILFSATIQFDPMHGLSLRIIDIDPAYSLGELEREKQQAINTLTQEGIFDRNKKTSLALLPQRIAVISVETSKGYSDYLKVIEQNPWGYKFFNLLFPSLLQGDRSVASILSQLRRIKKVSHHFDAVAIIRGGGGDVGLSSYNNYELAREVALFPIPVFTGIGHSTNETVVEMVSYKNAITPTELADFLIQKFHDFAMPVNRGEEVIAERSVRMIAEHKLRLHNVLRYFQSITHNRLLKSRHSIEGCALKVIQESRFLLRNRRTSIEDTLREMRMEVIARLTHESETLTDYQKEIALVSGKFIHRERETIQSMEKHISILDPINILRRGFSITLDRRGKAVRDANDLRRDEIIKTIFAGGTITSKVENINPDNNNE